MQELFRQALAGRERAGGLPASSTSIRLLSPLAWQALRTIATRRGSKPTRKLIRRIKHLAPYALSRLSFDCTREHQLLAKCGVVLARPADFMPRLVDYALHHRFGAGPVPQGDLAPRERASNVVRAAS